MNYQAIKKECEDNTHLISMVPVSEIIRFGYEIGLNENSKVLDLCCGYGTLLKVWNETYGISGVGVDLNNHFLSIGNERLQQEGIDKVLLICDDVTKYKDDEKYDVVICSETIETIQNTLELGEKFLKKGGILAYQKLYSKVQNPPQELVDFDGEVLPLLELNRIFNSLGFYMTCMASDTNSMWEHYVVNWSGKRDINMLRQNPNDEKLKQWIEKWYRMYFDYRRQYEGQALFGLERF
ncbi:MAG: methyltransferase protein [Herbinix sp.]|jgi:ubiquinone/menaquinone biosynthesis C-methylase UbiE|nr:methyltransferase protein [Herbinix sp.]